MICPINDLKSGSTHPKWTDFPKRLFIVTIVRLLNRFIRSPYMEWKQSPNQLIDHYNCYHQLIIHLHEDMGKL